MDFSVCSQCRIEIEGKGIHYRDRVFCSDECCEEFEAAYVASDEPEVDELEDKVDSDLEDEDLGYQDDEEKPKDKYLDDDFDINPEDF